MTLRVHMPRSGGDLFEEELTRRLGSSVRLTVGEVRPDPADYEVLVEGRPLLEDLDASERLRMVVIPYAGVPSVTRDLLRRRPEVEVHNLHHNAVPTAEMAIALLLAAARRIVPCDLALRKGDWSPRYVSDRSPLLAGRRALVLGYGAIGRCVTRVLGALGMKVSALRRTAMPAGGAEEGIGVHARDALELLLPEAEVLIVCLPATGETVGLLDAPRLALLPPGSLLVNVARGDVIVEQALYEALLSGRLAAAGLDVWYRYPEDPADRTCTLPASLPFHELENVVMSPHRAGHVDRTETLRAEHLAALLSAAGRGETVPNRVNLEAGY